LSSGRHVLFPVLWAKEMLDHVFIKDGLWSARAGTGFSGTGQLDLNNHSNLFLCLDSSQHRR